MLIIKSKTNLPREQMKNIYRNLLEQKDLGLIFLNDNYEVTEILDDPMECAKMIKKYCIDHDCTDCELADEDCSCRLRTSYPDDWKLKKEIEV